MNEPKFEAKKVVDKKEVKKEEKAVVKKEEKVEAKKEAKQELKKESKIAETKKELVKKEVKQTDSTKSLTSKKHEHTSSHHRHHDHHAHNSQVKSSKKKTAIKSDQKVKALVETQSKAQVFKQEAETQKQQAVSEFKETKKEVKQEAKKIVETAKEDGIDIKALVEKNNALWDQKYKTAIKEYEKKMTDGEEKFKQQEKQKSMLFQLEKSKLTEEH